MSLMCDLYVSTPEEAPKYDETQQAAEQDRAELTGFTYIEFSTLWAIIENKPWEDAHMDSFESIMEKDNGERMIFRFPEKFVALVAGLDDANIVIASDEWAETDEIECDPEELAPVIEEIRRVARVAKESGRGLYVWNCV